MCDAFDGYLDVLRAMSRQLLRKKHAGITLERCTLASQGFIELLSGNLREDDFHKLIRIADYIYFNITYK